MARVESLGINRLESIHYYVRDLERSRRFYTELMDFAEVGVSDPEIEQEGHQRSAVFQAGDIVIICSEPLTDVSRAGRFLRKHPEGVGTLIFDVQDIERTFTLLEQRGGTFITDIQRFQDDFGTLAFFNITTPFGDTTFRFVQRNGYRSLFPGLKHHQPFRGGQNRFGYSRFDHVTSNFQTMAPALLWLEHVMGFQRYWEIAFHTEDVSHGSDHGSGLRSQVMWDPNSSVKFANNEPFRPFFRSSQINIFTEDFRGDGVQHAALAVPDIISTVRGLRDRGMEFMPTSGSYYDALPERLTRLGIGTIDEDLDLLRDLQILVDGDREHSYLLQIFMKDAASLYHHQEAGPFFFEIIQRKGDEGFGGGNFRALFESIELEHRREGRL